MHAGGWAYGASVGGLRAKVLQKSHRRYGAFAVLTTFYACWQRELVQTRVRTRVQTRVVRGLADEFRSGNI